MKSYEEARRELYEQYLAEMRRYNAAENGEILKGNIQRDSKINFERQKVHREYIRKQKDLKKSYGMEQPVPIPDPATQ